MYVFKIIKKNYKEPGNIINLQNKYQVYILCEYLNKNKKYHNLKCICSHQ